MESHGLLSDAAISLLLQRKRGWAENMSRGRKAEAQDMGSESRLCLSLP